MLPLEELSFRNRVLFFADELLETHRTGKRSPDIPNSRKRKHDIWGEIYCFVGSVKNASIQTILTPRAIAVLTGLAELDDIDKDLGIAKLSEFFDIPPQSTQMKKKPKMKKPVVVKKKPKNENLPIPL